MTPKQKARPSMISNRNKPAKCTTKSDVTRIIQFIKVSEPTRSSHIEQKHAPADISHSRN